jgi:hypothetical protein
MRTIYKFKIDGANCEFTGPSNAEAIKTLVQDDGQPVLYLLFDRDAPPARYQVRMFPTAANVPHDAGEYVDTFVFKGPTGPFVAHVFYKQLSLITPS